MTSFPYQSATFDSMPIQSGRLADRYSADATLRYSILQTARLCASLTWPFILPPLNQNQQQRLPESHQSMGSLGMLYSVGKATSALFPANAPFFQLVPDSKIMFDRSVPNEVKQAIQDELYVHQLLLASMLESAHLDDPEGNHRRPVVFRARQTTSIAQMFITGDTLERLGDDFRMQTYRRDQYVTARDTCGDVLYHGILERVDPLSWQGDDGARWREKCKMESDEELRKKPVHERMKSLITFVEWQPWTRKWVICQECMGQEFNESDESITPFFSTPFHLVNGENYGRGLVESSWLGDLRSYNNLMKCELDFAGIASTIRLCLDPSCEADDEDFRSPSGSIIRSLPVKGGVVDQAAYLNFNKSVDFNIVEAVTARLHRDLSRVMAIESQITPQKERTTATQVQRIAAELDGMTGGQWGTVADEKQMPLVRRMVFLGRKKGLIPKTSDRAVKVEILTGLAALANQSKLGTMLQVIDVLSRLDPQKLPMVNFNVLVDVMQRYSNMYEPGLVKTQEDLDREKKQAMTDQLKAQAASQAIQSAGNIGEAALTQAATGSGE